MSVADLETLLRHAVNDAEFRKALQADPAKALQSKGIDPTTDRVTALRGISYPQLQALAKSFGHPDVSGVQ